MIAAPTYVLAEFGRGVYELAEFDRYDVDAAYEIVEQYRDLRIGLADASIAVCAKRWDARDVLTLDERHFRALRAAPRKRFRILPADGR